MSQQWPGQQPHQPQQPAHPPQGWTPPAPPAQGWQSPQPPQDGSGQYGQPPQQTHQQAHPGASNLPPPGFIALTLQGSEMTANLNTPRVLLNGHQMPVHYGLNTIPVPPGRHRIEVDSQWLRRFGQAAMDVDVVEGQQVPVFYATPYHQFSKGRIGHTKQKRPGLGGLLATLGIIFGFLALTIIVSILISA